MTDPVKGHSIALISDVPRTRVSQRPRKARAVAVGDSVMVVALGPHLTTMPQTKNSKPTKLNPSDAIQKPLRFVKTAMAPMAMPT